uniref:60S ribosomal protein L18a n=1 Tax=Lotus japonicus TaxID=34305 RepID=I3SUP3_LOTJA|nr:unknown [Lotus japonicus]
MGISEFQVVGRLQPSEDKPNPTIYRMRIFAKDDVKAKSRFWYFLSKYHKMKKTTGEILGVNRIFEEKPLIVKNYAVLARYDSRSGTHNLYKEFRDTSRVGAIEQLYQDMAGRHRSKPSGIQIIDIKPIKSSDCKRPSIKEFHNSKIKFPLPHRRQRAIAKRWRKRFQPKRPNTVF